jgi:hypothetical protein
MNERDFPTGLKFGNVENALTLRLKRPVLFLLKISSWHIFPASQTNSSE